MSNRSSPLLPATERRLRELGERIRLARLRRKLTAAHVAERAGMSPMTLRGIERGGPGVTLGAYAAVLQVLGLDTDIDQVGANDLVGRDLQDSRMRPAASANFKRGRGSSAPSAAKPLPSRPTEAAHGGMSAEELAKLVVPRARRKG